jgi:AcrR family transcriptional regulator
MLRLTAMTTKTRANAANTPENRLRILDAAALCFMNTGFEATSVDSIARKIRSTKGRIYYSYPSKTALLIGVMVEGMQRTEEAVQAAYDSTTDPFPRLSQMAKAHALLVMQALPYHVVTMDALDRHRRKAITPAQRNAINQILRQRDRYEERFTQVILDGIEAGIFRKVDPSLATKALFGALNSTALWYRPRRGQTAQEIEALAESVVSVTLNGIVA